MDTCIYIHTYMSYKRCVFFLLRLEKAAQLVGGDPKAGNSQRQPLLLLFQVPYEGQAAHVLHMCRWPRSVTCMFSGWWVNLGEHLWSYVVWFWRFSCGVLVLSDSCNPSPLSSTRFPGLCLIFGCGSLHLFLSVVGWKLSNNSYTRLLFAEYH